VLAHAVGTQPALESKPLQHASVANVLAIGKKGHQKPFNQCCLFCFSFMRVRMGQ
jgi:hypothetical protein